jgi:hypothetical protein
MKVTNWRRKIFASLVAGGTIVPSASYAVNIPLGDPSFEDYTVPSPPNYAYAVPPAGSYRPTSAWVDDLDSPPGFAQDAGRGNWIYNATYSEASGTNKRPAPRTGSQAMHGLDGNYNAQELGAVFEAGRTYTFALWAQNDQVLDQGDGVGLYIFDGNVPFRAATALSGNFFETINQRAAGMTQAQSSANWSQLSISHTVSTGAPEIGHPIGVGFRGFRDSAVDDATLDFQDASSQVLVAEVNTTNGQVRLRNQTVAAVNIDYYEITSPSSALNATAWNSLQEQNLPGFPAGNGSGNGWEQAGGSSATVISESYLTGSSTVAVNANVNLGAAFNVGGAQNLVFKYGALQNSTVSLTGDYNNNNIVDAADYVLWRKNNGLNVTLPNDSTPGSVGPADYTVWRANFGRTGGPTGPGTLTPGFIRYVTSFSGAGAAVVPEPGTILLVGIGFAFVALGERPKK